MLFKKRFKLRVIFCVFIAFSLPFISSLFCLNWSGQLYAQSNKVDSLYKILLFAERDTSRIKILLDIYNDESINNDTLLSICEKIIKIADRNVTSQKSKVDNLFSNAKAEAFRGMAFVYSAKGDILNANNYCKKSLAIYSDNNNQIGLVDVYCQMGNNYRDRGKIKDALNCFYKALEISRKINYAIGIGSSFTNIGLLYSQQGDQANTLKYYQLGEEFYKKTTDLHGMAVIQSNLGEYYLRNNQPEKSMVYFKNSLNLKEQINDAYGISLSLNEIGALYASQKKYPEALNFYNRSLGISRKINNQSGIAASLTLIGMVATKLNKYDLAISSHLEAIEIFKKLSLRSGLSKNALLLSNIYESMGQYKKAHESFKLYKQIEDSILNDDIRQTIIKKQMEYEYEMKTLMFKQKQIQKENRLKLNNEQNIRKKNSWVYLLVSLSIVLSFTGLFIYINAKQKQKFSHQEIIVLEQKMLRSQMNPHFIFNSLGIIHSYIQNHKSEIAADYLIKFSKLIRLILENSRQDFISLEKEKETLSYYLNLSQMVVNKGFDYHIHIDENIDQETTMIPPMLAQPFIENAIKHGFKDMDSKGEITINFRKVKNDILFEVLDNGVGIETTKKEKKVNSSGHHSLGTQIVFERLANINKRYGSKIEITMADLVDKNKKVIGTKVEFEIPYITGV